LILISPTPDPFQAGKLNTLDPREVDESVVCHPSTAQALQINRRYQNETTRQSQ
jgi:hypothetical protein